MRLNSASLISIIAFGAVLAALLVFSVSGAPASGPGTSAAAQSDSDVESETRVTVPMHGYITISDLNPSAGGTVTVETFVTGLNTNTSQFFITLDAAPHLNPHVNGELKPCATPEISCHAVFGKVIKGMNVVLSIEQGDTIESIDLLGQIAIPVDR